MGASHPTAGREGLMVRAGGSRLYVHPAPGHSTSGSDISKGAQVTLRVPLDSTHTAWLLLLAAALTRSTDTP